MARRRRHATLQFQPGTTFHYSNLDYEVLGKIVERLTGRSLTDEMQVRIFRPLGLDDTELRAGPAIDRPYAHGYDISGSAPVDVTMTATQPRENFAASNIVSTTDDLARFFHALQGGQLLPATLLAQMTTVFPTALDWTDIPSSGYGLGQIRYELPCGQAWGHGGGIDGFLTQVFADRRGQRIVVVAVTAGGTRPGQAKARLATEFYCRGR